MNPAEEFLIRATVATLAILADQEGTTEENLGSRAADIAVAAIDRLAKTPGCFDEHETHQLADFVEKKKTRSSEVDGIRDFYKKAKAEAHRAEEEKK